jgi:GT2 family glycosyltransferase
VLIVSYNTRQLTVDCIRSVIDAISDLSSEILVVDNASPDGSAEAIASTFGDRITLEALDRNVGFARANNLAARSATSRYMLLLNPDTIVDAEAIQTLLGFAADHPRAGIWGGRTIFADGSLNPTCCWARATPWSLLCYGLGLHSLLGESRLFNPEAYGGWLRDADRPVDIVTGCFLMIERSLWDRLEGFDPTFFLSGEEADLCLRAIAIGHQPIFCASAQIVHHSSQSFASPAEREIAFLRGRQQLADKHWTRSLARYNRSMQALWVLRRLWLLRLAGSLGHKRARTRARELLEVWNHRDTWLHPRADIPERPTTSDIQPLIDGDSTRTMRSHAAR